jgi:hypothetical protein
MKSKLNRRRREAGSLPLQIVAALAVSAAVAVLAGTFVSKPWASAQQDPLHGLSFAKGCLAPTIVGQQYRCNFLITNNLDQGPDTLTVTSLVDVVHAHPADASSGNVLTTLSLGFLGGASCNGGQTVCTLPPGGSVYTTAPLAFYTTDATDPNPLEDDAVLTWQDSCSSGAKNCPSGDQTITTGSQSPLYTPTPTETNTPTNTPTNTSTPTKTNTPARSTSTPTDRKEKTSTPRAETPTPRPNTPAPVSSVAPATVAPSGVTALPDTGEGGGGSSGLIAALIAGMSTMGVLLVAGRIRSLRSPR